MGILRTLACAIWFADMETTLYLTTTEGGVTPKGYPQLGCSCGPRLLTYPLSSWGWGKNRGGGDIKEAN